LFSLATLLTCTAFHGFTSIPNTLFVFLSGLLRHLHFRLSLRTLRYDYGFDLEFFLNPILGIDFGSCHSLEASAPAVTAFCVSFSISSPRSFFFLPVDELVFLFVLLVFLLVESSECIKTQPVSSSSSFFFPFINQPTLFTFFPSSPLLHSLLFSSPLPFPPSPSP